MTRRSCAKNCRRRETSKVLCKSAGECFQQAIEARIIILGKRLALICVRLRESCTCDNYRDGVLQEEAGVCVCATSADLVSQGWCYAAVGCPAPFGIGPSFC